MQRDALEGIILILGVVSISVTHALLPSHWLPFTLFARTHKWSLKKTLITTMIAALIHTFSAIALGISVVILGKRFLKNFDIDIVTAAILMLIGIAYIILYISKRHFQHHHELSEKTTIIGLYLAMLFSPCGAIPIVYIAASKGGELLVFLMSIILIIVNVGTLLIIVSLSLLGIQKLQFKFLDQHEKLIIGIILCALAISIRLLCCD